MITYHNMIKNKIYLSRHGQSLYNLENRLGGNPDLSDKGKLYAIKLKNFVEGTDIEYVYTSGLLRTINTAKYINLPKEKKIYLDELNAGICEDLTYEDVKEKYPDEFEKRKLDKLNYRYPEGESYIDLVNRLKPIFEMIKNEDRVILIVAHQAILRVIYGILTDKPKETFPFIEIPLHTIFCLENNQEKINKLL